MRKESKLIAEALIAGTPLRMARTHTDGDKLFLHNNLIAVKTDKGYTLTLAGWATVTTRERLNALLDCLGLGKQGFSQRAGVQYFTNEQGESRVISDTEVIDIIC